MKISRMKKGEWGKVVAFFDVETEEGFIIKGFKLVNHDGLFVGFPSIKDEGEGKYLNTVYADKTLSMKLNEIAQKHYNENQQNQAYGAFI